MHPALVIAPILIGTAFLGGVASVTHARAEANDRAQQTQECRDVTTAKYTTGDIDSEEAFELALDECDVLR